MKTLLRLGAFVCLLLLCPQLAFAQAAAPVISPAAGTYASTQSVTVTDATSGADIFCTTNGSTPTPESPRYTGPITVSASTTVKCTAAVAGVRRNNIQNDNPNAPGTYWKAADWVDTGGNGTPTNLIHRSGISSPSLSGASMEFSFTNPGGRQVNVLWATHGSAGSCDNCTYHIYDYHLYDAPSNDSAHATTEQDRFNFMSSRGLRDMDGAQWRRGTGGCAAGHECLDIGGNNNVHWTFTGVSTTLFSTGAWHHFVRAEHTVPSEYTTKPCVDFNGTHWACVYEDYWIVDGTKFDNGGAGWKYPMNALPGGWGSVDFIQHQGDIGSAGGTWTEYLDQANYVSYFPASTVSSSAFTITGGGGTPTATTPSISPAGGFVSGASVSVTISDSTPGAVIHYTTDGSTPNGSSATFSGALSISSNTTVKAIAIATGYLNSAVASAVYTFGGSGGLTATPTFSPAGGSFTTGQFVTLSDTTSGAVIYYTTDGTTPTTSSNVYSAPLNVTATATIKAMAVAPGLTNSSVASATYTIVATPTAATPTFSPLAGIFTGTQTVTVSDTSPSPTIYCTIDGSTPTTSSTVYSAPLTVSSTTTVKCIATSSGFATSAVGSATYTIGCGQTPFATGNIDYSQTKAAARQGAGPMFQMAAGSFTTGHAAVYDCNGDLIDSGSAPGGTGTVTSVGLSLPGIFTVSGSPVTTSGTLTAALATETANAFFAGPSSGSAAAPTFRAIVPADLPVSSSSAFGAAKCDGTTITCSGGVYTAVGGSSGTVTSVGLTVPSRQTVTGSPVTSSGTLAITDNTQNANLIFAGPPSGSAAAPTFRSLVGADLPVMVGDTGSGGTKGAVPAPGAGDSAAGKYLKADGTFAVPPGTASSPLTTKGDLYTYDTASTRLPVGTDGYVLAADSTQSKGIKWTAPGTGLTQIIGLVIPGGGVTPATGAKGTIPVPFNCTITGWTMLADVSGSAQITVSKGTYAAYPTVSSIVASAPPNLSSALKNTTTTLTGWTTTLTAGDILSFNLDSVSTVTYIILELQVVRN